MGAPRGFFGCAFIPGLYRPLGIAAARAAIFFFRARKTPAPACGTARGGCGGAFFFRLRMMLRTAAFVAAIFFWVAGSGLFFLHVRAAPAGYLMDCSGAAPWR